MIAILCRLWFGYSKFFSYAKKWRNSRKNVMDFLDVPWIISTFVLSLPIDCWFHYGWFFSICITLINSFVMSFLHSNFHLWWCSCKLWESCVHNPFLKVNYYWIRLRVLVSTVAINQTSCSIIKSRIWSFHIIYNMLNQAPP